MVQIAREFVRPGSFIFRRSWKRLITGVDVIVIGGGLGCFFLPGKGWESVDRGLCFSLVPHSSCPCLKVS